MYALARKVLFAINPESSHHLALDMLGALERMQLLGVFAPAVAARPTEVMGLQFPNAVGMAAGLDKNGDYFNALGKLGFGHVEIGTVTPRPQPGNPKPRLFRLPDQQAIINRMGFNNKGVDHLVSQVKRRRFDGILGINIGKNADTPVESAVNDYIIGMEKVYPYADYITVNISSPNTPGLRNLQYGETLTALLSELKEQQAMHAQTVGKYVPVAVKIAPDMTAEEVGQVAETLLAVEVDGVIATNTTIGREGVQGALHAEEAGGLSGAPVREKSTTVVRLLSAALDQQIPIIGVGGICSGEDAAEKIAAGAALVQIYSGFIYRGPELIAEAADAIASL
ncbi:quinone-dependent dihydroorotate dehydrogenase [Simiduia agarivorans]|uniref:Dihydroorotate dehydrogenase (quinone) n=1 Tax=Simiduia agarivorans (strain DSM 21679 / JCM 13881 / BCRC 17597 / SA1) TaxID=1117647 RepID=K4KTY1_SIMAS|nr:quinone-dependent dihydroorotate dehydrogenase [Simiduia agarivorans]AFU97442.1 dihydroorotate dehydrogenase 2 [Simiduia agarivorans SA1 = DSM 21679]